MTLMAVEEPLAVDKRDVARSFSLAASSYDQVAALQRRVADTLLAKIPTDSFHSLLDLGCGTGVMSAQLANMAGVEEVYGLDIAQGMLEFARSQHPHEKLVWCAGDAESLPLKNETLDLVFSSLAVQWCADFQQVCSELQRVLKPGGYGLVATLGPQTLYELRSAWQQVDGYQHVNRFISLDEVTRAVAETGFDYEIFTETVVMHYQDLKQLTAELKALGAHNVNRGRPKGLTSRQRIETLKAGYEVFRNDDGWLPASYEVYYLRMRKPL